MEEYAIPEAAQLLGVSHSRLRQWIAEDKKLRAQINTQRRSYDMRQRYMTRAQLEALSAKHHRTIGKRKSSATVSTYEQDIPAILARLDALERRLDALGHQPVAVDASERKATPAPLQHVTEGNAPAQSQTAIRLWLIEHGANGRTVRDWQDLPLEPEEALRYAIEHQTYKRVSWRLHRCERSDCVCMRLL